MKKIRIWRIGLTVVLLMTRTACSTGASKDVKYVDIYYIVKDAFLTDQGYTDEMAKYMAQDVFNRTNIYKAYRIEQRGIKKPLNIDFSLKEISQKKQGDKVSVYMTYSAFIYDADHKLIGGAKDVQIIFIAQIKDNGWYIVQKEETA
ncbi:hypothetical protein [Desulfitobacterium sp.]|uniref:hypothetical protein n=1 Tax=Desulfitobacterium sp. TaxID=49981 RepID=UPI002B92C453|nr:hypothetical protein [Desulfitobacterium sp.]HVJ49091.1 hypothetical protein [Desulfitobacterium sp.]